MATPARYQHSHSHSHAGLTTSPPQLQQQAQPKSAANFRASVDTSATAKNWRATQPAAGSGPRPSSEAFGNGQKFASPETEAIDRWFEDLQHYEATLEEMAAASLDANFKEELSAIEQWFRVLSEAERTAALYSLLQSATQVQMRFFVTVLQQMARNDPVMGGLMSPAVIGQQTMESQMEAKLAALQTSSSTSPTTAAPPSPARFAGRQSLGPDAAFLSPGDVTTTSAGVAAEKQKIKSGYRTSAPAQLFLGGVMGDMERGRDRSPSPGRSGEEDGGREVHPNGAFVGQNLSQSTGPPASSGFLRSPHPSSGNHLSSSVNTNSSSNNNLNSATNNNNNHTNDNYDLSSQLSPLVGGSWASMVNTPLVPMFLKNNDGGHFGGLSSPGLDNANARLGSWGGHNNNNQQRDSSGIVLDDVRKFRRSARISGDGMSGFESQHQNAINLGLGGMPTTPRGGNGGGGLMSPSSPGGLLSAQQAAISAQQNWRNGLNSPGLAGGNNNNNHHSHSNDNLIPHDQFAGSPSNHSQNGNNGSAQQQLANLFALQQQMQLQQLNMAAAAGIALTPVQMYGLQQQQGALLSPGGRMMMGGMGGMGMGMGGMGMGMGGMGMIGGGMGMPSPRRSPRANDRSPGGTNNSKSPSSNMPSAAGSGSNPDEAIDPTLLADVPAWLRSLRLHKYTPNFEGCNWKDMVLLDEAGLEKIGVSALGARRKLLKVFETVRGKMGMALPGDGALSAGNDGTSSRSVSPAGADRDP